MKTIRQLLVVSMVLFALPAFAQELEKDPPLPTMDEVTKKLDDLYRAESSHATMKMIVVNKRGTRELTLESWSKGQDTSLILIRKPAREAGTATLLTEEVLVIRFTFRRPLSSFSIGSVTRRSISTGETPKYAVDTITIGIAISGAASRGSLK